MLAVSHLGRESHRNSYMEGGANIFEDVPVGTLYRSEVADLLLLSRAVGHGARASQIHPFAFLGLSDVAELLSHFGVLVRG